MVEIIPLPLYNQNVPEVGSTTMPLNPPRVLILRAHALEIFISVASITLGIFVWLSLKDSNSGVNILVGTALLVAGVILFGSAMRTILKH